MLAAVATTLSDVHVMQPQLARGLKLTMLLLEPRRGIAHLVAALLREERLDADRPPGRRYIRRLPIISRP